MKSKTHSLGACLPYHHCACTSAFAASLADVVSQITKEELSTAVALDISTRLLQTADGPELLCPTHALSEVVGNAARLDSISFMVGFGTVERPATCLERNMLPVCPAQPTNSPGAAELKSYLKDLCG